MPPESGPGGLRGLPATRRPESAQPGEIGPVGIPTSPSELLGWIGDAPDGWEAAVAYQQGWLSSKGERLYDDATQGILDKGKEVLQK